MNSINSDPEEIRPSVYEFNASTGTVSHTHSDCGCLTRTRPPPRPSSIPFEPIPDNREKLEHWIKNRHASSATNKCEHSPLPKMTGDPLAIHFKNAVEPRAVHKLIPAPHHWKNKVKSDLNLDVAFGIIEHVPPGVPARRTIDYQALNSATYRETHHKPPPFHQVSTILANTKKTTLDAWEGYHLLKLSPTDSNATTFITESGRYLYNSATQGFHGAAGDGYTKSYDKITEYITKMLEVVDESPLGIEYT